MSTKTKDKIGYQQLHELFAYFGFNFHFKLSPYKISDGPMLECNWYKHNKEQGVLHSEKHPKLEHEENIEILYLHIPNTWNQEGEYEELESMCEKLWKAIKKTGICIEIKNGNSSSLREYSISEIQWGTKDEGEHENEIQRIRVLDYNRPTNIDLIVIFLVCKKTYMEYKVE